MRSLPIFAVLVLFLTPTLGAQHQQKCRVAERPYQALRKLTVYAGRLCQRPVSFV